MEICRRQWHPTPVLLPGKPHGRRSLVGFSPWGHEESDTTERLHFHFSLPCTGEGNGNPLQFLPGESQGRGSLVGCRLWRHTESDTTEATQQQQQQYQIKQNKIIENQQQRENLKSSKKAMTPDIEETTVLMISDFSLENMKIKRQCI